MPDTTVDDHVDLRCGEGHLGARIVAGNLIETECRKCRGLHPEAQRVLHRWSIVGDLVETVVVTIPTLPDPEVGPWGRRPG